MKASEVIDNFTAYHTGWPEWQRVVGNWKSNTAALGTLACKWIASPLELLVLMEVTVNVQNANLQQTIKYSSIAISIETAKYVITRIYPYIERFPLISEKNK